MRSIGYALRDGISLACGPDKGEKMPLRGNPLDFPQELLPGGSHDGHVAGVFPGSPIGTGMLEPR